MFPGILVLAQSYIWTLFECRGPSSLTEINKRPHNPADILTLKQKVQGRSCAVTKLHWLRCCSIGRLDALARSFYLERGHSHSDSVTTPEGLEIRKDIFTALFKTTRIWKYKSQLTFAFFTAVNHPSGPLRKQNLLQRVQKVMVCDLWI